MDHIRLGCPVGMTVKFEVWLVKVPAVELILWAAGINLIAYEEAVDL